MGAQIRAKVLAEVKQKSVASLLSSAGAKTLPLLQSSRTVACSDLRRTS